MRVSICLPTPIRSPWFISNEISFKTSGESKEQGVSRIYNRFQLLPSEYRAERFSTRRDPLLGQYAGGFPSSDGLGSCVIRKNPKIRSKL